MSSQYGREGGGGETRPPSPRISGPAAPTHSAAARAARPQARGAIALAAAGPFSSGVGPSAPARGTRHVRLVRAEGRGVSD